MIKYDDFGFNESKKFTKLCDKAVKKHKAFKFTQTFYDGLTKKFADKPFGEMLKNEYTNGYCYYYALLLCSALPNSELKIGNLNALNSNYNDCYFVPFGHAWVEKDDVVYDTTYKMKFKKDYYYKLFEAEVCDTYSHNTVNNPEQFFKLGMSSVKNRIEKVNNMQNILTDNFAIPKERIHKELEPIIFSK